jgi:hypothetical protein
MQQAVEEFGRRERRFGKTSAQVAAPASGVTKERS